jgi:hypothetical protein
MGNTLKKIQTVTVGAGGASTIVFNSIPQTYTDLKIVVSSRNSLDDASFFVRPNGATTNLSARDVRGSGSSTQSINDPSIFASCMVPSSYTASVFGNGEVYISNYTSSNFKSISIDGVAENNATGTTMSLAAGLWSSTAAITSITLIAGSNGNFVQYSTATLYGIKNYTLDNPGGKATGGIVTQDNNYWYHTFINTGSLVTTASFSADYLIVAGGGGSGYYGGGGGAGGLLTGTSSLTTGTTYPIVIGAGGATTNGANAEGNSGSNSTFNSLTAIGGGGSGKSINGTGRNGLSGGSGGGAAYLSGTGGAGTSGQGNAGGNGPGSYFGGGGGGGAGAAGSNPVGDVGGAGGIGVQSSISGTATYYAGGGGGDGNPQGGVGGNGGGGNGSVDTPSFIAGQNGTVSTGGGGGGNNNLGTSGGSGIVIVRYAK